jgi:hypothetical protein
MYKLLVSALSVEHTAERALVVKHAMATYCFVSFRACLITPMPSCTSSWAFSAVLELMLCSAVFSSSSCERPATASLSISMTNLSSSTYRSANTRSAGDTREAINAGSTMIHRCRWWSLPEDAQKTASRLKCSHTLTSIVEGSSVRIAVSPASISTPLSFTLLHCGGSSPMMVTLDMRAFAMLNTSGALATALLQCIMIKATPRQRRAVCSQKSLKMDGVTNRNGRETSRPHEESSVMCAHLLSVLCKQ